METLPGILLVLILGGGFLSFIVIQLVVGFAGMLFGVTGVKAPDQGRTMTIKENYHDYDEDY